MATMIRLNCLLCVDEKYPELNRFLLPAKSFIDTIREFELANLVVTDIVISHGGFFNNKQVHGVIDIKGSPIPFFIDEKQIDSLRKLILDETSSSTVKL